MNHPDTPRTSRRATQSVTLDVVAKHAGVSPQTVSRAIRRPDLVSERTLERVQESIVATGYVPNLAASNLASNRSYTVAVLIPAVSASVFAATVQGLDSVLAPHGYHLFIGTTEYKFHEEEELLRAFLGRRPDGVFLVGAEHTSTARALLETAKVPVVESWDVSDDPIDSVVGFSNAEATSRLVEYVHSLGYRHPTFAGHFEGDDVRAHKRRDAFTRSLGELYPGEPVRVLDAIGLGVTMAAGAEMLRRALDRHPETDVLMFASDVFASGAILEAERMGLRIPDELGVTGFGGFEVAKHLVPSVTTVEVPSYEIGVRAGQVLLNRMQNPAEAAPERIDLGFVLVPGESTRQIE